MSATSPPEGRRCTAPWRAYIPPMPARNTLKLLTYWRNTVATMRITSLSWRRSPASWKVGMSQGDPGKGSARAPAWWWQLQLGNSNLKEKHVSKDWGGELVTACMLHTGNSGRPQAGGTVAKHSELQLKVKPVVKWSHWAPKGQMLLPSSSKKIILSTAEAL